MTQGLYTVTVEKARSVLGEKAEQMTDEQIVDLLQLFRFICDKSIEATISWHKESN